MPRIISKRTLQAIVLTLLPLSIVLAGYWSFADRGMYHFIAAAREDSLVWRGLSILLTLLFNLIGVAVIAIILRSFVHDMPTLREQLQKDADMLKTPGTLQEKLEAATQQQAGPQVVIGKRTIAVAVISVGLALGLVGIASLLMTWDTIYAFQMILLLLAPGLLIWGIVNLLRGDDKGRNK
jgi:hypothetical protein